MTDGRRLGAVLALVAGAAATIVALVAGNAPAQQDQGARNLVRLPMFAGDFAAWAPDSSSVAVPEARQISIYGLDGKVERRLKGPGIGYFGFPCECGVSWVADGSRIQFVSEEEELGEAGSVIGSVAADGSGEEHRNIGVPVGSAAWAPSGWPLVYVPNSRTTNGVTGKPVGPTSDLWRLESLAAKPEKLLTAPGVEWDPRFSPDASQIAFQRERGENTSLWVVNADGTGLRRLIGSLLGPSEDAWSPDGRHLALTTYSRRRGDRRCHLYVLSPHGGRPHEITDEEVRSVRPAWTPDGRWITFATFSGKIRKIRPDGTGLRTIAEFPGQEVGALSWSPDGKYLTYSARTPPHTD